MNAVGCKHVAGNWAMLLLPMGSNHCPMEAHKQSKDLTLHYFKVYIMSCSKHSLSLSPVCQESCSSSHWSSPWQDSWISCKCKAPFGLVGKQQRLKAFSSFFTSHPEMKGAIAGKITSNSGAGFTALPSDQPLARTLVLLLLAICRCCVP